MNGKKSDRSVSTEENKGRKQELVEETRNVRRKKKQGRKRN